MNSKFLKWAGCLAVMLAWAACSSNDIADSNELPDGKYPMTFTATGLDVTAVSRATVDGNWERSNEVAVQVEGVAKKYIPNSNGESVTLTATVGETPFYWQNTRNIKVSAWYCGTGYNLTLPEKWEVQSDQNTNGYERSDFLYAPPTDIDFQGTHSITFYHQTAKVVINIRNYGVTTDASKISSVSIKSILEGDFKKDFNGNYCLSAFGSSYVAITPQTTTANTGVVFEVNHTETALASYQALVIPQDLGSNTPIEISINGYDTFKYIPTGKWEDGMQYTYNLTIKGSEVIATVANDNISWGNEPSGIGAGVVEI